MKSLLKIFLLIMTMPIFSAQLSNVRVSSLGSTGNTISYANTSRNVAVTPTGDIYVAWHGSNGIFIAKSVDRGATFNTPLQILATNYEVELAVSSSGVVYLAWVEGSTAKITRSIDGGVTFNTPVIMGTSNGSAVHLATFGENVYGLDTPGTTVFYSTDNGTTFNTTTTGGSYVFSDLAVDNNTGELIVQTDNPSLYLYKSNDNGATLTPVVSVPGSVMYSVGTMTTTNTGTYYYVAGYTTSAYRIDTSNPSVSVSLPIPNSDSSNGRSMSADNLNNLVTGYTSGGSVLYSISTDLGATFSPGVVVSTSSTSAGAAINYTNGDVMFVYESNGEIYFATYGEELPHYEIQMSTNVLTFESILANNTSNNQTLTLTNTGTVDADLTNFLVDAPFSIQSNSCVSTLLIGESCEVEFNYSSAIVGNKSGTFTFNVGGITRTVYLRGNVIATAAIAVFDVSSLDLTNPKTKTVTLTNTGNQNLTINGINISNGDFTQTNNCGAILPQSTSCTINVTSISTIPGSYSAILSLDSDTMGIIPTVNLTAVVYPSVCGDGVKESLEQCDDGNLDDNDGCSSSCIIETGWECYDAEILNPSFEEGTIGVLTSMTGGLTGWNITSGEIDHDAYIPTTDGLYLIDLSGCSAGTISQTIVTESGKPHRLAFDYGGNGPNRTFTVNIYNSDDNNLITTQNFTGSGDTLVSGYVDFTTVSVNTKIEFKSTENSCTGNWLDNIRMITVCFDTCGDGIKSTGEECDDGNTDNDDGCSSSCIIESGWSCSNNNAEILNPSFEEGILGYGVTSGLTNWSIDSGDLDHGPDAVSDGSYAIDLSGCSPATISQLITTELGKLYRLSFDYRANGNGLISRSFTINVYNNLDNSLIASKTLSTTNLNFIKGYIDFTTLSTNTKIEFKSNEINGECFGSFLDNLKIVSSCFNINDAPEISGEASTTVNEDTLYSFTPIATDADLIYGDSLSFSIQNKPVWANFNIATGELSGTPDNSQVGVYSDIIITVTDTKGANASLPTFSIEVVNTNDAPVIVGEPLTLVNEDLAYSFVPSYTDDDTIHGDTISFTIQNKPIWANFNTATGELSGTPLNEHVGEYSNILITAIDASGASSSLPPFSIIVVNVNDTPVISGEPSVTVDEDSAYSFIPVGSDDDTIHGDSFSFSIENKPVWATFNTEIGELSGTPDNSHVGVYSDIIITITDSNSASNSLPAFSIEVVNINDTPVIAGEPSTSVNEDSAYSFVPSYTDDDTIYGDTIRYSIENRPVWANFNTVTGELSGTPLNEHVGVHSNIIITAIDDAGASNSLPAFSITV
ncbi:choice-of-anchor D domain-containing protein, partial [bacterium]|nr:choice-of-anchor D domain-containing protein [bacterium]